MATDARDRVVIIGPEAVGCGSRGGALPVITP